MWRRCNESVPPTRRRVWLGLSRPGIPSLLPERMISPPGKGGKSICKAVTACVSLAIL